MNASAATFEPSLDNRTYGHPHPLDPIKDAPTTRAFELAAHYGIPQSLPAPPRAHSRPPDSETQTSPHLDVPPDFEALRQSYLRMLSSAPSENHAPTAIPEPSTPAPTSMPMALEPQIDESSLQPIIDLIEASPEFRTARSFLTSPYTPYLDDFTTSPMDDSPFVADLNTPIMDQIDEFEYGVVNTDSACINDDFVNPLYNETTVSYYPQPPAQPGPDKKENHAAGLLNTEKLYTFSPSSPLLENFYSPVTQPVRSPVTHPTSSLYPSPRAPTSAFSKPASGRNRSKSRGPSLSATGTRRDITPASMVPLDAPTQTRNYVLPSSTSRKVNPIHAQKRSYSQAFGDQEQDELVGESPPGPNATEIEHIEWKRRQNTIAARKTRRRKLEYLQRVEAENVVLRDERDKWKVRCGVLEDIVKAHGVAVPVWDDE
ncbi:uncharacterized protein C8R40DRAFT_1153058 [Lentinula edodes]|uniref:uncharacterized protein n=1 Tax=Lentinula edodes TaxID=5353 RepID=UPI001E8CB480|nr:uncharacterized protein C8R40DRAFT_1153058 [Lentinula edodes]KAH7871218.1 hypothetical protein C8R40DRAFT_1153058 [Lentinula edodes]